MVVRATYPKVLPVQPCGKGRKAVYYPMPKTKTNLVKKTLLIPEDEYLKFRKTHPSHGSFTWFVRTALRRYNLINTTDPNELVDLAVGEITLKD